MKKGWKKFIVICASVGLIGLAVAMAGIALGGSTALTVRVGQDVMVYQPWGSSFHRQSGLTEHGLVDNLIRLVRSGEELELWDEGWPEDWADPEDLEDLEDLIDYGLEGLLDGLEEGADYQVQDRINQWFKEGEITMGPIEKQTLENITSLDLTAVSADIKVQKGDKYTLSILQRNDKLEVGYQVRDGRLIVKERKRPGIDGNLGNLKNNEIIVTLPGSPALEELQLQTVSGDIQVETEGGTAELVKLYTVSGDVEAALLSAGRADLQSVSGDLELKADVSQGLSAHSVSGDIDLQGKLEGQLKIDAISGNVELDIRKGADQYQYECSSISGHIQAEGRQYKRSVSKAGGPDRISITTISGNICIKFGQD